MGFFLNFSEEEMHLKNNIKKNYVYLFISSLSISDAIWMLFLAYRGMSLWQIGLLESFYHIFSMLFELPTGIVADRFGRKTSRALGRVFALLGTLTMLSAHDFWVFVVAFLFTALSYNLESGAGDALIYDTLVLLNQKEGYMKIKGVMELCFQSARVSSLVIGGWVATYSYELGYQMALVVHALAFVTSLFFKEPVVTSQKLDTEATRPSVWHHVKNSWIIIQSNQQMMHYLIFIESFSLFNTTLYFYFQNFLNREGFIEWQIGLTLAVGSLLSVVMALLAHRIEHRYGRIKIIKTTTLFALLCLAGIAFMPFQAVYFVLFMGIDGLLFVAFSDYINQIIPSEHRATLLSFQAMVFSVMMIVLFPIVGLIADLWGFKTAFVTIFILAVPIMLTTRKRLKQHIDKEV